MRVQKRVLEALFMREIQTRWGRRNLGFAWLIAEPLLFAIPVLGMWSLMREPIEHGLPLIPMLWSGYLPLLMYRHVTAHAVFVVRSNSAVLYHQAVTPLDIIFGTCGLEVIGNIAATATSFFLLYLLGFINWPHSFSLFLIGILFMAWWSFSVALIVAALSEQTDMIEHIWPPITYMYLPICGFFYLAEWLPVPIRHVALTVMPSLHAYEMIRSGLFGNRIQAFYDMSYLAALLAVLTIVGLWLVRDVRRHLEFD